MKNKKMLEYIATERARGISDADIKKAFMEKGWTTQQLAILFAPPKEKINWATFFIGSSLFQGRMNNVNFGIIFVVGVVLNYIYLQTSSIAFKTSALMLLFIFGIGVWIRRLHDINKSGWWVILLFTPIVNLLFGLYLCYKKGDEGVNVYGQPEPPKRNFFKSLINIK